MITDSERERYARHLLLPGFGEKAQIRLKNSKVLLIGAGGLGSPASLYMVAAGIGELTVVEFDEIDESNLQRQILYSEETVGKKKALEAKKRLESLNRNCRINLIEEPFSISNALQLCSEHDLIVDGSDNFETRYLANDAAFFAGKPLVYGSIFQFEGQSTVFHPTYEGPCYRCMVPEPPAEGAVPNCLEAGVIGALAGVIGTIQATEAIKLLAQVGEPPYGKMLHYEALQTRFRNFTLKKDPKCPLCSEQKIITSLEQVHVTACANQSLKSISAQAFQEIYQPEHFDGILIDVREPQEFATSRIEGSQLIPLNTLEDTLSNLPSEKTYYIHCHSGMRSEKACRIMTENGFNKVINIEGGIVSWNKL